MRIKTYPANPGEHDRPTRKKVKPVYAPQEYEYDGSDEIAEEA